MDVDQQDGMEEQQAQPQTQVPVPDIPLSSLPSVPSLTQPQSNDVVTGEQPGLQQATQKQLTDAKSTPDPKKCKLIQQQLVLLLHAYKCQRESQANGEMRQCALSNCKTMKNVLKHMKSCQAGKNCTVAHCSMSRKIINHWNYCNQNDCPVCLPIKQANKKKTNSVQGQPGRVMAMLKQGIKEWRTFFTRDVRNHQIHRMVNVIYLNPNLHARLDRRMHNMVTHVRKIEADIFKRANSRAEYCNLFSKKVYELQMETVALLTTSKYSLRYS